MKLLCFGKQGEQKSQDFGQLSNREKETKRNDSSLQMRTKERAEAVLEEGKEDYDLTSCNTVETQRSGNDPY